MDDCVCVIWPDMTTLPWWREKVMVCYNSLWNYINLDSSVPYVNLQPRVECFLTPVIICRVRLRSDAPTRLSFFHPHLSQSFTHTLLVFQPHSISISPTPLSFFHPHSISLSLIPLSVFHTHLSQSFTHTSLSVFHPHSISLSPALLSVKYVLIGWALVHWWIRIN